MSAVALLAGALAIIGTILATVRVRRPSFLSPPVMMTSWLVGELAVFHIVAQAIAAAGLSAAGALHRATGRVGVGLLALSIVGLAAVQRKASRSSAVFEADLRRGLGDSYRDRIDSSFADSIAPPPTRQAWLPFRFDHRGVDVQRDIPYGEHGKRNLLDIYRPAGVGAGASLPVVLFVHGGAWMIGDKTQQGKPLLLHLARRGYVGVTINYRLAPRSRWPAPIIDLKRAIAWTNEHISDHGGDASFLAIAGASAGGHLATLAALTPNDPAFQPGFEEADTRVSACIPIYAPFDLTDHFAIRRRASLRRFLERYVMTSKLGHDPDGWRAASPLFRITRDAPPMFVMQGDLDVLVWREETRAFVEALTQVSAAPVVAAYLPGAQHAFEVFNSVRSAAATDAVARFLASVRSSAPARPGS